VHGRFCWARGTGFALVAGFSRLLPRAFHLGGPGLGLAVVTFLLFPDFLFVVLALPPRPLVRLLRLSGPMVFYSGGR